MIFLMRLFVIGLLYIYAFICLFKNDLLQAVVCLFVQKMFCCMRLAVLSCFEIASVPKGQTALGGGGFN